MNAPTLWEGVGEGFAVEHLMAARQVGWNVLQALAQRVVVGADTAELKRLLNEELQAAGVQKQWHPAQLRIGQNTCCAFGEEALSAEPLRHGDIFFLDIGPLVNGYEADVGQTFVLGQPGSDNGLFLEKQRCAADAKILHALGVEHWRTTQCTGRELYAWSQEQAQQRGWKQTLHEAAGHRLGDFPHHRFFKGLMIECDFTPASHRWVYEIQLRSPCGSYGAFYEDLLF